MRTEQADQNTIVYFDGRYVPLRDAHVNVLTHGLNYGTGVFEGIRGYWSADRETVYLVRAIEHYERWKRNADVIRINIGPSAQDLVDITAELCRRNMFQSNVYVRPIAYKSSARVGVAPDDNDAFAIVVVPFGDYFESAQGLNAGVVSWRRIEDTAIPGRAKICGAYVNSVLATDEARRNGYDEAIFLTEDGHVAEGATCNLFMVRGGKLITPAPTDNILEGITRASIIDLAKRELRLDVVERTIDRSELYMAEEVFFTGTAVEVAPIVTVDRRRVGTGNVGPTTDRLRALYVAATRGRMPDYMRWLTPVRESVAAESHKEVLHASGDGDRFVGIAVTTR